VIAAVTNREEPPVITKRIVVSRLFASLVLLAVSGSAFADATSQLPNKFVLGFKRGYLNLADDSQTIAGTERRFDDTSNVWAIEGEWRAAPDENVAFGGEILHFNNRYMRTSTSGNNFEDKMRTQALILKSKYIFDATKYWQPYAGFGIGLVTAHDSTGAIEGIAEGVGVQGVAGMQFRSTRVGFRIEYMLLHSTLDDDKGDKIKVTSQGVMFGMAFYLGPKPK
jgi:opacity protein-like surface antigen